MAIDAVMVSIRRGTILLLACCLLGAAPAMASYVLCLGTYNAADAEALHGRLNAQGYPVYLLYGETYEVRMGSYDTREKAEAIVEKLKTEEKIVARIEEEEDLDQYQTTWDAAETAVEVPAGSDRAADEGSVRNYSDPRAKKMMSLALDLFGHPYKYGGTRIGKGIDCSFFVQTIFHGMDINLPRTSGEQFRVGRQVDRDELKVGDLLFFQKTYYSKRRGKKRKGVTRINHVGIYIGSGEFIHATLNVNHVTISRLDEPYFTKRFAGARRVFSE
jgi:cell wall-associated NlpC family hydrolase